MPESKPDTAMLVVPAAEVVVLTRFDPTYVFTLKLEAFASADQLAVNPLLAGVAAPAVGVVNVVLSFVETEIILDAAELVYDPPFPIAVTV